MSHVVLNFTTGLNTFSSNVLSFAYAGNVIPLSSTVTGYIRMDASCNITVVPWTGYSGSTGGFNTIKTLTYGSHSEPSTPGNPAGMVEVDLAPSAHSYAGATMTVTQNGYLLLHGYDADGTPHFIGSVAVDTSINNFWGWTPSYNPFGSNPQTVYIYYTSGVMKKVTYTDSGFGTLSASLGTYNSGLANAWDVNSMRGSPGLRHANHFSLSFTSIGQGRNQTWVLPTNSDTAALGSAAYSRTEPVSGGTITNGGITYQRFNNFQHNNGNMVVFGWATNVLEHWNYTGSAMVADGSLDFTSYIPSGMTIQSAPYVWSNLSTGDVHAFTYYCDSSFVNQGYIVVWDPFDWNGAGPEVQVKSVTMSSNGAAMMYNENDDLYVLYEPSDGSAAYWDRWSYLAPTRVTGTLSESWNVSAGATFVPTTVTGITWVLVALSETANNDNAIGVDAGAAPGNHPTWWLWTPTQNWPGVTFTSNPGVTISVYSGSRATALGVTGGTTTVTFDATAGTTYFLAITTPSSSTTLTTYSLNAPFDSGVYGGSGVPDPTIDTPTPPTVTHPSHTIPSDPTDGVSSTGAPYYAEYAWLAAQVDKYQTLYYMDGNDLSGTVDGGTAGGQ